MATAEQYADWIVKNKDKQGTPEFNTVAEAYKIARAETQNVPIAKQATEVKNERSLPSAIGRQIGLTGRYVAEGLANTVGIFSDPLAATSNMALGTDLKPLGQATSNVLDRAGFPSPETGRERNVAEASKLMVGTGGIIGGAATQASKVASPVTNKVLTSIATRPGMQAVGSAGAGYAGSEAREQGASPAVQFGASVLGGLGIPIGLSAIENAGKSISTSVKNIIGLNRSEQIANNAINKAGVKIEQLPKDVQKLILDDVQSALKTGKNLSPEAVKRLVDYRQTGLTPMGSSLNLNPAQITQERNLAKISANSKDPAAQQLATLQRDNDIKLISGLNTLGAQTDDAVTAGNKLISALNVKDEATKRIINNYYSQARETSGRSAKLDPYAFTQTANNSLDEALLGGKIPNDVRNILNSIATGKTPFTVDVAEQYKTAIGTLQRSSNDPAERLALGKVREALDNTPLLDGQGQKAIDAFNKARAANRTYMQIVEKTPALKAVRDGVEPDKFVQNFIVGNGAKSNIADVKALRDSLKDNKEAISTVRGQILAHLKSKATGGKADEVANFSPSNYNSTLKTIGEDKLNLFFTPEDISMLKAIGRVSSYEKFQPTGSAVNNSNTSAALFTAMLDKIANSPVIRKIPLGGALVADPAKDVVVAVQARNALNAPRSLTITAPKVKKPANVPIGALLGLGATSKNEGN
jgi:hypothetical protein